MQPQTASTRVVRSSSSYQEAQRAVDFLSDNRFPVQNVAIIGAGLKFVEQVTGRRGTLQATGSTALSGAAVGALLGWLFGLFNWIELLISALVLAFWGAIIGVVIGALVGLLSHLATGGQRDFSSVSTMAADRYDVVVNAEVADEAQRLLAGLDAGSAEPAAVPSGRNDT